jgi:hypothetical protein
MNFFGDSASDADVRDGLREKTAMCCVQDEQITYSLIDQLNRGK